MMKRCSRWFWLSLALGGAAWLLTEDGQLVGSKPVPNASGTGYVNRDPAGFSLGGKAAVGLMVALDFLEPMRALHARAKGIYQHTFVFMEVAVFDAGLTQNQVARLLASANTGVGNAALDYLGSTLIVGAERLPMISAGFAISF